MSNGLFSLMTERLALHSNQFTMTTYNVLFEVHLLLQLSTTMKSSSKGLLMENNKPSYAAFSLFKHMQISRTCWHGLLEINAPLGQEI